MNSTWSRAILSGLFTLGLNVVPALAQESSVVLVAQSNWEREAEETFRLGHGTGRRLMTQEEWRQHQREMKRLNGQERERYREQWHEKMMKRAREKNIKMPDSPGPPAGRGPAGGGGPGGGGKGPGGR
ncbi:MAG: hypothetical protein ACM3TN_03845 [Alphaproteobacteria bacterium]